MSLNIKEIEYESELIKNLNEEKKKKTDEREKNTTSPNKVVISSDMPKQGDNFILINVPKNAINLIKLILILFSLKKIKIQMKTNLNLLIIKL